MKIKKGDNVIVTVGKDKGRTGRVLEVFPAENRVRVEGVAVYKRHLKAGRSQSAPEGGIIERNATIDASNVQVLDPATNKPTRIGYKFEGDKKVRVGRGKLAGALLDTK